MKGMKLAEYDKNRDPVKKRARRRIRDRIHAGTLRRGNCMVCDEPEAQAHHEDYSKPLQIHWLCSKHHAAVHWGKLSVASIPPILVAENTSHHMVTINGRTLTVLGWAKESGMKHSKILKRIEAGWKAEHLLLPGDFSGKRDYANKVTA